MSQWKEWGYDWFRDLEDRELKVMDELRICDLPSGTVIKTKWGLYVVNGGILSDIENRGSDRFSDDLAIVFGPWPRMTTCFFAGYELADEKFGREWTIVSIPIELVVHLNDLILKVWNRTLELANREGDWFDGTPAEQKVE